MSEKQWSNIVTSNKIKCYQKGEPSHMKPGKVVQQITHIVHLLPIKKQGLCHMKRVKSEEWDLLENEMASDSDSTKWFRFLYDSITDYFITFKKAK